MRTIENVLEVIKEIDCKDDELYNKIRSAYEGYEYDGKTEVVIERKEKYDESDLKAYSAHIDAKDAPEIIAVIREGADGYVATVMNAYIH
ncbi:hypothetical protein N4T77_08865 [Clostridium sp. CX1]|uniref:hypothetical protein n=1 Tax=Clostridium sp. CX1 TaxID=2978346 RepID=UPI0021BFA642|nr:hypothetical protein [Clostridium sp. CX1]MCT8976708.1 hypothetical protein [Clostridium sp. CX1]